MRTFAIALFVTFAAIAAGQSENAPSPAETDISLEDFEKEFGQFTADEALGKEWAENLENCEGEIDAQNEKFEDGDSSFFEKLNEFSQLSKDEFEKEKTGLLEEEGRKFATGLLRMDPEEAKRLSESNEAFFARYRLSRGSAPASINSVDSNKVTAVKNQGNCGSCASFSATSLLETCMLVGGDNVNKAQLDLSEQDLMDCAFDNGDAAGCNGATMPVYQQWVVNSNGGGLSHENTGPYTAAKKTCAKNSAYNSGAKAKDAKYTSSCNEETMMNLVAQYGSVSTAVAASGPLQNYGGGIFDGCSADQETAQDHAVTVVGYGTENNVPYWLVKNSWGGSWGESGYFRIKRGAKMCGIGAECVVMDCSAASGATDAPPAAPSTQSPSEAEAAGKACDMSSWDAIWGTLNGRDTLIFNGLPPASINCVNSQCVPASPTNQSACQYICGKDSCAFNRSAKVQRH